MGKTFVNLTNHPSAFWDDKQLAAAVEFGSIIDIPFPSVEPTAGGAEIAAMADACVAKIRTFEHPTVLIQGEFTLVYAIVTRLKKEGVKALAACSKREAVEVMAGDGSVVKRAVFCFKRFREYI